MANLQSHNVPASNVHLSLKKIRSSPEQKLAIIIGAGLAGISTAQALMEKGINTLIIDTGMDVANGSSHANAGMLTSSMSDPWNTPGLAKQLLRTTFSGRSPITISLSKVLSSSIWGISFLQHANTTHYNYATRKNYILAKYSLTKTQELKRKLKLRFDSQSNGSLKIFRGDNAFQRARGLAKFLAKDGLIFEELTASEVAKREPLLNGTKSSIVGALFFPDDEVGDAQKYSKQLVRHIRENGGQLSLNTVVNEIIIKDNCAVGVRTSSGNIAADLVVVAAGYSSANLLKKHGIRLPIKPVKGYTATFECDKKFLPKIPIVDDELHTVVANIGGKLRVSGIAEIAGASTKVRIKRIHELSDSLKGLSPELSDNLDWNKAKTWAGLRPVSADGLPFIGETKINGLYVNTGHGHLGWTMAAGSGHLLANHIMGHQTEIPITPYAALRGRD